MAVNHVVTGANPVCGAYGEAILGETSWL